MKIWIQQYLRNMLIGTVISGFWHTVYQWSLSFWIATVATNTVGFFVCRYWLFKEGNDSQVIVIHRMIPTEWGFEIHTKNRGILKIKQEVPK